MGEWPLGEGDGFGVGVVVDAGEEWKSGVLAEDFDSELDVLSAVWVCSSDGDGRPFSGWNIKMRSQWTG